MGRCSFAMSLFVVLVEPLFVVHEISEAMRWGIALSGDLWDGPRVVAYINQENPKQVSFAFLS